ncbi:MAG: hypothetical protein OXI33_05305 [Chloroflexota bacterium]|nr:hypothetical protein [Chloroflexota bacterium]
MPASAKEVRLAGMGWITALRAATIRTLVAAGDLPLSLFDVQGSDMVRVFPDPKLAGSRLSGASTGTGSPGR